MKLLQELMYRPLSPEEVKELREQVQAWNKRHPEFKAVEGRATGVNWDISTARVVIHVGRKLESTDIDLFASAPETYAFLGKESCPIDEVEKGLDALLKKVADRLKEDLGRPSHVQLEKGLPKEEARKKAPWKPAYGDCRGFHYDAKTGVATWT